MDKELRLEVLQEGMILKPAPPETTVKVDYVLTEGGTLPSQGHDLDVGMDLYTTEDALIVPGMIGSTMIGLGIKTQFDAYQLGMLITPRSVMAKLPLMMGNTAGVIEGTYTGEIKLPLRSTFTGGGLGNFVAHAIYYDTEEKEIKQIHVSDIDDGVLNKTYNKYAKDMETLGYEPFPDRNVFSEGVPVGTVFIPKGTRLVQAYLIPRYKIELNPVEQLKETPRGEGGFGSTGVNLA